MSLMNQMYVDLMSTTHETNNDDKDQNQETNKVKRNIIDTYYILFLIIF